MKKNAPRRSMFPKEFVVDLNATKAAERCGYSKKSARNAGARLMANANIQAAVRELMKKRQERLEIDSDKWLRELALIYFADVTHYLQRDPKTSLVIVKPFEMFPPDGSRAIESIEEKVSLTEGRHLKLKLHSKLEAGKLIGQHLGFLKEPEVKAPGLEKALYELSEKFLPVVHREKKTRSDEPK